MADEGTDYEDIFFKYAEMAEAFDDPEVCYIVALDRFQLALIQASLKYAYWPSRWDDLGSTPFSDIVGRVAETEECLMSGCQVSDLIQAISDLNTTLSNGLAQLHTDISGLGTIGGGATEITDAVDVLTGNLEDAWVLIEAIATVMGATIPELPAPLP